MIDAAKHMLRDFIADVYITVDQRKGPQAGKCVFFCCLLDSHGFCSFRSPGFGIFLTAETTEGVFYHGEAMSKPVEVLEEERATAEEVGFEAAQKLLGEIYRVRAAFFYLCMLTDLPFQGGACDTTAQTLATTFMAMGDRDISKMVLGERSLQTVHVMRDLHSFFEHKFKIDELRNIDDEKVIKAAGAGSRDKAIFTCVGIGYLNLNKGIV